MVLMRKSLLSTLLLTACLTSVFSASAAEKLSPPQIMRKLESTLKEILIDTSSDSRFNDQKHRARIRKNAEQLARLAKQVRQLKPGSLAGDQDPTIAVLAGMFADQADHAVTTLKAGQRTYARDVLRGMSQYCVSCHSRTNVGPSFGSDGSQITQLEPFEQAQFFAATRQFDRAIASYEKLLGDQSKDAAFSTLWERAVRSSLAIAVRVTRDPSKALALVQQVQSNAQAPAFLRKQAEAWKDAIDQWKKETRKDESRSEESLLAEAQKLIDQARFAQKYPADRSADIQYLRASAVLHDLLGKYPNGKKAPEALYLAGLTYEVLQDLGLWDLHEFYFISCIHQSPHTQIAERCYQHYEQNAFVAFSGSGGTYLPSEVRARLKQLSDLAAPSAPQGPQ